MVSVPGKGTVARQQKALKIVYPVIMVKISKTEGSTSWYVVGTTYTYHAI